ncbi:MAG: sigma-70 family RNA polymerase sigma factor [Lachnospiraceae bacterium]|nr:sigma-70 family RNA polymerase sigma factor [Lachnospiraceae bacterium]
MTQNEFDLCMNKIKSGDKEGLRIIYESYISYVYTVIYGVLGNKENAEDVTSEFFIRLWKNAGSYVPQGSHVAYIATVARHMAIDFLRKYKGEVLLDEMPEETSESGLPETEVVGDMTLKEALECLNDKERTVVSMKVISEMTFQEISDTLGIPLGTVTWRYRNAIEKLRRCGFE